MISDKSKSESKENTFRKNWKIFIGTEDNGRSASVNVGREKETQEMIFIWNSQIMTRELKCFCNEQSNKHFLTLKDWKVYWNFVVFGGIQKESLNIHMKE